METRSQERQVVLQGGGLLLRFVRLEDRYQQHLAAVQGERCIELLSSVEGEPGQMWPSSPPLQEMHQPPNGAAEIALLVGMAGRNHWSLSARFDEPEQWIEFEAASRVGEPPSRLGSTYLLSDGVRAVARAGRVELDCGEVRCRLEQNGDGQGRHGRVDIRDGQLVLEPPVVFGPFPVTVCWRYTIQRIE